MVDKMGTGARGRLHTSPDSRRSMCIYRPIPFLVPTRFVWVGECVDLFHGSLWEVVRVHSAGELIPIEGGKDPSINRALLKRIVKTPCMSG